MKIEVRFQGLAVPASLKAHIARRLQHALTSFRDRIQWVRVALRDVNGPRGGADKECQVQLRLRGTSDVIVRDRETDAHAAFDRAAGRVVFALQRQIGRRRQVQRGLRGLELLPA
ncbi:MAG: HPF/RaiA family ribosome-associated protein [Zoogloeaceae bacterium]|nr:HPF/RaiA family ribosome-associated protein [Zoogloeaceae bacterium]